MDYNLIKPNPPGRPHTLEQEHIDKVLPFVRNNYTLFQVARLSQIPYTTLRRWLDTGKKDAEAGVESLHAQLWLKFEEKIGIEIQSLLDQLRSLGNYQALSWILEKCFREDFGSDSQEVKELRDLFKIILPQLGKGDVLNETNRSKEKGDT